MKTQLPPTTEELVKYLNQEYPKDSKAYMFMMILFINDYHRHCRDTLLFSLSTKDPELAGQVMMAKLIGSAIYSTYEWVRHLDPELARLVLTKENSGLFRRYFNADSIKNSEDRVSDLVHGEGYMKRLRESVLKTIKDDEDTPA